MPAPCTISRSCWRAAAKRPRILPAPENGSPWRPNCGIRDSQFNLAILYARGNGVKQDLEESYKWFAVAARDGDTDAAQKRDEVAKALNADQLKSAKAKFDAWKLTPLDAKANRSMCRTPGSARA